MTLYSELSDAIERDAGEQVLSWARAALNRVVTEPAGVTAVLHPLGFLCLPVHRDGDEGVCVHLWEPGRGVAPPTTSPTHCHSWDLVSWVLVGKLRNQTIRVAAAATPTHRVFEVLSDTDGDTIEATDRLVRAHVTATSTHRAGESYRLPAGVFHETVIPGGQDLVATVALGTSIPNTADLSLGGLRTTSHRVRRRPGTRQETVDAAVVVLAAIADGRVPG
ncbi:hypothetical protein JOD54_005779 [Actinokineospora baliensis]|uniref:hypothetical protein n=1 Tax=Actinokineospora baliensis TaxID=547056 RepID=UPI00195844FF|nr:hypothetical protein [Actinokineospora baliensis]MBM7775575.1 hypothetical protein [Actinokineospora baliensis]